MAGEEAVERKRLTEAELETLSEACLTYGPIQVVDVIAEVRRLRQLVIDAEPYVPDSEQTRTMDLPRRLRAEIDQPPSGEG